MRKSLSETSADSVDITVSPPTPLIWTAETEWSANYEGSKRYIRFRQSILYLPRQTVSFVRGTVTLFLLTNLQNLTSYKLDGSRLDWWPNN